MLDTKLRRELEKALESLGSERQKRRARALLWVDDGEPVSRVARRLRVSRQSVYTWMNWVYQRNVQPVVQRLEDAARTGRPSRKSEALDRVIARVLSSNPREAGYCDEEWTNALLRDHLCRRYQLEVSHQTLRRAIHRAGYRWDGSRYALSDGSE